MRWGGCSCWTWWRADGTRERVILPVPRARTVAGADRVRRFDDQGRARAPRRPHQRVLRGVRGAGGSPMSMEKVRSTMVRRRRMLVGYRHVIGSDTEALRDAGLAAGLHLVNERDESWMDGLRA